MSVQLVALLCNIGLLVMKFTVGHFAHSRALIADGYNSAGDVLTTFVAWLAFRYGRTPPDDDHPYGHGNAETLAGLLIGAMLVATGGFIAVEGIDAWLSASAQLQVPERLAIWAALATIGTKALLWAVSERVGRHHNSPTLRASARDHRADVMTGGVALIGITLARGGLPWFDAVSGVLIGLYIGWLGLGPVRDNLDILMQREPPGIGERARNVALEVDEAEDVRDVRVQPHGGTYRIDMVLLIHGEATVRHAHDVAHAIEDRIRERIDHVTEVIVHVEPAE